MNKRDTKAARFTLHTVATGYLEVGLLPPGLLGEHPHQGLAGHLDLIHGLDGLNSKTDHTSTLDSVIQPFMGSDSTKGYYTGSLCIFTRLCILSRPLDSTKYVTRKNIQPY